MEMKSKRFGTACHCISGLSGLLCLFGIAGVSALAQVPSPAPAPSQAKQPAEKATAPSPQAAGEKAWGILRDELKDDSADKRAKAVRALGLLPGNVEAEKAAVNAFKDDKANVRLAAAVALGSMHAQHASPELEKALDDSELTVVLAAANSLLLLHDDAGYEVYYAVVTGERRANKGLIKEHLATLMDKKKMAELGFEEGIGFIPFAGIGYEIFKTVTKNDASPVRAAAAKKLAHDPDPGSAEALVTATTDKNWAVRAAALEAIAQRGDRWLVPKIADALDDDKDVVRFAAAACVAHLSEPPAKKNTAKTAKP
jgi:HEAT repeat protein